MVRELREAGVTQPFCAMTYYNPLLRYGVERFVDDAVAAGIDGLIVPDLPPEEADEVIAACRAGRAGHDLLLAPTSTEERIRFVTRNCTGFIYLVSVTGITGTRKNCRPTWPISCSVCAAIPNCRWPSALASAPASKPPQSPRSPTA